MIEAVIVSVKLCNKYVAQWNLYMFYLTYSGSDSKHNLNLKYIYLL